MSSIRANLSHLSPFHPTLSPKVLKDIQFDYFCSLSWFPRCPNHQISPNYCQTSKIWQQTRESLWSCCFEVQLSGKKWPWPRRCSSCKWSIGSLVVVEKVKTLFLSSTRWHFHLSRRWEKRPNVQTAFKSLPSAWVKISKNMLIFNAVDLQRKHRSKRIYFVMFA